MKVEVEDDCEEDAVCKNDRQYAEDPRQNVEISLVARQLVEQHREIEQLEDTHEHTGDTGPKAFEYRRHEGKEPIHKSIHEFVYLFSNVCFGVMFWVFDI